MNVKFSCQPVFDGSDVIMSAIAECWRNGVSLTELTAGSASGNPDYRFRAYLSAGGGVEFDAFFTLSTSYDAKGVLKSDVSVKAAGDVTDFPAES